MSETPVDYQALAIQSATQGNVPAPPSTLYFTYLRTDGDSFVGAATNAVAYIRKGYTITGEQTIEDFAVWVEEQGKQDAPAAKTSAAAKTSSKTTADTPQTAA
jgi:hypothetical protein